MVRNGWRPYFFFPQPDGTVRVGLNPADMGQGITVHVRGVRS